MKKIICCICGKECETPYGNNPYPLNKNKGAKCCDKCNLKVIEARIKESKKENLQNRK